MTNRELEDKNLGESFESLDFWEHLRTLSSERLDKLSIDINNKFDYIEKNIDRRLESIERQVNEKTDEVVKSLRFMSELKAEFQKEIINLNELSNQLEKFKGANIVLNNPTYDQLIELLRNDLMSNAKKDGDKFDRYITDKNNLLNEHIACRIGNLEAIAVKTDEVSNTMARHFDNFAEVMKRGNSAILSSETIVARLIYSMRFIEKLPEDLKKKILDFSEADFSKISEYFSNVKTDDNPLENLPKEDPLEELKEESKNEQKTPVKNVYTSQVVGSING